VGQTFFVTLVRPLATLVLILAFICAVASPAVCQQFLDIHDFIQYPNGADPWPLVADAAGNLYGQANGGTYGAGVVFKLTPQANGTYSSTLLYVFPGVSAAGLPDYGGNGPLVFDTAGNLYGASGGGTYNTTLNGCGTVYELSPSASGTWTKTTVYAFACTPDGNQPNGKLTFDSAGNLYGTTVYGGANNYGTVFELSPNGQGGWTETTLYSFTGQTDGGYPTANLVLDKSGNIYGSTTVGGELLACVTSNGDPEGCGVYFELTHDSDGIWSESVLYALLATDGLDTVQLAFGSDGYLYGVASVGPYQNYNNHGYGLLFRLSSASGGGWTYTILYAFEGGPDGAGPTSLFLGNDGNWYGSTYAGGTLSTCTSCGTIFSITPKTSYPWKDKILYQFGHTGQGTNPTGVISDQAGNLYATAGYQNIDQCCGVVSKLTKSAGRWNTTVIYDFASGYDGSEPSTALAQDSAGNLYGNAFYGGEYGNGILFELAKLADGTWQEQVMHSFQGKADGANPSMPLVVDSSGNVYGTTFGSIDDAYGSAYELKRNASGTWEFTTIYSFKGGADGYQPGGLAIGPNGNIYGITYYGGVGNCQFGGSGCGTIFELTRHSANWSKTTVYQFQGTSDAGAADGTPVFDDEGNLYGVGLNSPNTAVYKLSPGASGTWTFTILVDFKNILAGDPITVADGNVYGVIGSSTSYPNGAVYRVSTGGGFNGRRVGPSSPPDILYSFTGGAAGDDPIAVTRDSAGNLYGTTYSGGSCQGSSYGCGIIFKLTPSGNSWTESVLYDFQSYSELSPLIVDSSANLYGADSQGGSDFNGFIFEYSPNATLDTSRPQQGVR
jgi:uncharacterized repeat protein (TIGR03803 family)